MKKFDLLIVGGGMVGLTFALAVRKQSDLTIAIVDSQTIETTINIQAPELRVSAINSASKQLFQNLAVWDDIITQRFQAYHAMHVWDKAGYGKCEFSLNDANHWLKAFFNLESNKPINELGYIIENKVICRALWHKAEQDHAITFFTNDKLQQITQSEHDVFASFAMNNDTGNSQPPILAKMVIGADGAHSWLRKQMDVPMIFRDYDHHAIVATVQCSQCHQNTAWQVFLPQGPLAFLPLYEKDLCSIVWSTTPEESERLLALSPEAFSKEITAASDGKLGNISVQSERISFPLTMRFAQEFIKDRMVLIGDAAHTIHPLAGQGVNLGLLDAAALAQTLTGSYQQDNQQNNHHYRGSTSKNYQIDDFYKAKLLQQFARWRKSEALEMIAAMEGIKQVFTPQHKLVNVIRGLGMTLFNNSQPLKTIIIHQALGFKGQLPELAKLPK